MADDPAIIQRAYDLVLWAVPAIAKFPRSFRFVLGKLTKGLCRNNSAVGGQGLLEIDRERWG